MRTEVRFVLAFVLVMLVLTGTNLLFSPAPEPEPGPLPETVQEEVSAPPPTSVEPSTATPEVTPQPELTLSTEPAAAVEEQLVVVEGPLYRYTFSTVGARLVSSELLEYESFTREGPVELVPEPDQGALGMRFNGVRDTIDFRGLPFEPSTSGTLQVSGPDGATALVFSYRPQDQPLEAQVTYTFDPDHYLIGVSGRIQGLGRGVLISDLGSGIALNEVRPEDEMRSVGYVFNHVESGIDDDGLDQVMSPMSVAGPLHWSAFKSKYFLFAMLPGATLEEGETLGGLLLSPRPEENLTEISATMPVGQESFEYRVYAGPQEFARLSVYGNDLEDANPYGFKFLRPALRPIVGIIVTVLVFLHEKLSLGYGWVLILFGVLMRVALFPLNQKAMRSQLRTMAVQPLLKEIQTKYKNDPERLQKEMLKLYREHGFNPLGGCLPMLIPMPVLFALFFVFQGTIELRGVSFLWLADLSLPDPIFILPITMAASVFLMQWVSQRSMDTPNPQMKMMMWIMPIFMLFIFFSLPAGLNLYYATSNLATLPQQYWIAQERKKIKAEQGGGGQKPAASKPATSKPDK